VYVRIEAGVLKQVDAMKEFYALNKGLHENDPVDPAEIQKHAGGRVPKCPGGGTYTYNNIGVLPVCSFAGSEGPKPEKEIIMYFFWKWKIPPSAPHELRYGHPRPVNPSRNL
jgi:hypothetical protein